MINLHSKAVRWAKEKLFGALAAVCALAATLVASSACIWYLYQPEEPEALSDK